MNDRELLELAAKAAGIKLEVNTKDYAVETLGHLAATFVGGGLQFIPWNPLTDDGDALRLAVKLGLCVDCVQGADVVQFFIASDPENGARSYGIDITNHDRVAATRRAIVMAAAAIGEPK